MVIDHPHDRSVVFLSAVPDNRYVRHSRYVGHACPSAVPYGKKGFAAHSVDIDRRRTGRSKPLPYTKRCNIFVGVGALDDPHDIIISYQLMFSIQIRPPLRES